MRAVPLALVLLALSSAASAQDVISRVIAPAAIVSGDWSDNMAGVWFLEEDTTADRADSSGNGKNLTASESIARSTDKQQGSFSVDLDGADERLSTTAAGLAPATDASVTWGCWGKTSQSARGTIIGKFASNDGFQMERRTGPTKIACLVDNQVATSVNATFEGGVWVHGVCRYDGTADLIQPFINGAVSDSAVAEAQNPASAGAFVIGADQDGTTDNYDGLLDECFVHIGALTAASVCKIASCGVDGKLCICNPGSPTTYADKGRNVGSCMDTSPVDCNAASPVTQ